MPDRHRKKEWACTGCGSKFLLPRRRRRFTTSWCNSCGKLIPTQPSCQFSIWFNNLVDIKPSSLLTTTPVITTQPDDGPLDSAASSASADTPNAVLGPARSPPSGDSMVFGAKRAVLCGVSYRGQRNELKGSSNDVKCIKYLLKNRFGFSENCIITLTEDEVDPLRLPTRRNLRVAMQWLVRGCRPGDSLVFHFSGHGLRQPDFDGNMIDAYSEALLPVDYTTEGVLTDNEINATIVRSLPYGAKLHAIIDACHSGTVFDLPFTCKRNSNGIYEWCNYNKSLNVQTDTKGGEAFCFSSCDDNENSVDTSAFSGDTMTGAMTYSFIQAIEHGGGNTYGYMLNAIQSAIDDANSGNGPIFSLLRKLCGMHLNQVPQLSSSLQFNIHEKSFSL